MRWDRWFHGVLGFSRGFGGIENARSIRNVGCIRGLQKRVVTAKICTILFTCMRTRYRTH